jgi:hypothetical protein
MTRALASLLFFVPFAISCSVDVGKAKITTTIDPNLPREDPWSYPDNPIPSVPPVIACPYKATNACPDVWASDSADASSDAATRDAAQPEAFADAGFADAGVADEPSADTAEDDDGG